ncbi:MAG: IS66 family insertion sequence element accessory protein TnpB [Lachnospiraceae bacterium]|nr:IS66 family insertion sequence element accessory protein TnpB [Lachnospiraceae bacterium]
MLGGNGLSFTRIILAVNRTDMRLGIDGLSALVRLRYGLDPLDKGTLFLFCGRRKDRIKGLIWTGDRFILIYVRLAEGRFQWPRTEDEARGLSAEEFNRLMDGYSIDPSIGAKRTVEKTDPKHLRKG